MGSLKERLSARAAALRERRPVVDHVLRTFDHYSVRDGNAQAGSVTFFAYLSFFPLLALAFFVVGYLSAVAPEVRGELVDAIEELFPGLIGTGDGQIPLATFEEYGGRVGLIGLLTLLYTGSAWVSAMRRALGVMFVLPVEDRLSFAPGKLRDLAALAVLGVVLLLSVSLSGAMTWSSEVILRSLGLNQLLLAELLLRAVGVGLAIAATTVLFMALYALVPKPQVTRRAMWQGALTGALGFELLKSGAGALIALTMARPAFQVLGVSLILLVWINYFSRLVMLSTSWAYTAPAAQEVRHLAQQPLLDDEDVELAEPEPAAVAPEDDGDADPPLVRARRRRRVEQVGALSVAGLGTVAALTWLARRRQH
jgi:membrane protein